jgi:hypothetical protein
VAATQWESKDEDALRNGSKVSLLRLLDNLGFLGSTDVVNNLYEGLLTIVKQAAEQPWESKGKKIIKKDWLIEQVNRILNPYPNLKHNATLSKKLMDGGLDATYVESANDLRRHYTKEIRQPKFLESTGREYFDAAVLAKLLELRSQLDSGMIQDNGIVFHNRCLDSVRDLSLKRPAQVQEPPEGFLQGCMYEITARCKHRFVKRST